VSFSHKAFEFDWLRFQVELAPLLYRCLADGRVQPLIEFADQFRDSLAGPYEGEPLEPDWQRNLGDSDVQEVGDYALTRYYSPAADKGLGETWMQVESRLDDEGRHSLLGTAFGPPDNEFDPGKMGSYFQSPDGVRTSLAVLKRVGIKELADYLSLLDTASKHGRGVYVTF